MFFAGVKQWFLRCDAKDTRNREKMIYLTELFFKKYASNTTTKERKRNQKNAREDLRGTYLLGACIKPIIYLFWLSSGGPISRLERHVASGLVNLSDGNVSEHKE